LLSSSEKAELSVGPPEVEIEVVTTGDYVKSVSYNHINTATQNVSLYCYIDCLF